ncbi:endonuclease-8 [Micromonospora olivasterospora]|uniref:Endonuclease-8 n=1 Tax=Micromonospora olivasterospora TaxID=1880 RepID=A0A562I5N8_MICOL|nr:endonuclease-8 [Micromonospora olivasterospora]
MRLDAAIGKLRLAAVPEGHSIHRLAARHAELFAGDKVHAASPQGRFAEGAARLAGTVLEGTEAYGKHLLHHYAGELTLHVHLGLYGKFADGPGEPPPPVGQVRLRLTSDLHWLDLRGPTACELLTPPEVAALRERLGPTRCAPTPTRPGRTPGSPAARRRSRRCCWTSPWWPARG